LGENREQVAREGVSGLTADGNGVLGLRMHLLSMKDNVRKALGGGILFGGKNREGDQVAHIQESKVLAGGLVKDRGRQDVVLNQGGKGGFQLVLAVNLNHLSLVDWDVLHLRTKKGGDGERGELKGC